MDTLAASLSDLAGTAFRWSAIAFLVVNGLAVGAFALTRDRRLVNRFTSPLLAVNLLLLGTGIAVPALAVSMKMVVQAVASLGPGSTVTVSEAEVPQR